MYEPACVYMAEPAALHHDGAEVSAPWLEGMHAYAVHEPCTAANEQRAMKAYLPMVKSVVRQLASQAQGVMDLDDLLQVGWMGLLESVRRYGEPDEAFGSYARQRVRGAILDELRRQDWRPRAVRQSVHKTRDAVRELRRKLGREPTPEQVQQALGLDAAGYLAFEQADAAEAMASLDEMVSNGLDIGSSNHDPAHSVLQRLALEQALAQLSEREQRVIQLYYEFDLNLKEIAAVLEISEARVCQLNKAALRKMRAALEGVSSDAG